MSYCQVRRSKAINSTIAVYWQKQLDMVEVCTVRVAAISVMSRKTYDRSRQNPNKLTLAPFDILKSCKYLPKGTALFNWENI